jgi:hypothetical protein
MVITQSSLTTLQDIVKKLNRRAARLNLEEIQVITKTESQKALFVLKADSFRREVTDLDDDRFEELRTSDRWKLHCILDLIDVEIIGNAPQLAGWHLVATLEPADGVDNTNIVKTVPGEEASPRFRSMVGHCEHCNKIRRRKDTFVVQREDGLQKCVGRDCSADFLGHKDINATLNYAASLAEFGSSLDDLRLTNEEIMDEDRFWGTGPGWRPTWALEEFLVATLKTIRAFGWVPKSAVADFSEGRATASIVQDYLQPPNRGTEDYESWQKLEAELEKHTVRIKDAKLVMEWCLSLDPTNDYLHNLQTIARAGFVTGKTAGLAASMVAGWKRATDQEIERAAKKTCDEWFGEVGKRYELTLSVDRIFELEGHYGVTGLHVMHDEDGRQFKWFASGNTEWLEDEDELLQDVKVKATVKAHDEYKGTKQTVVSRVKILS